MEYFLVYLFMQSTSIITIFKGALFVSSFLTIMFTIGFILNSVTPGADLNNMFKKIIKIACLGVVFFGLLTGFFPSRETIGAMYVIPNVINYASISSLPKNVEQYLELFIQNEISKLQPKKAEN